MIGPARPAARALGWRDASYPYLLLLLANLAWSSNWVVGRALHQAFPPVALSFWRWGVAALVLAPLAIPRLRGHWPIIWRRRWLLLVLGTTGVATFQAIIYAGLDYTTAVNATIINAGSPLIMVLMVWAIEGTPASPRQWLGMALTFLGVLTIVARGDWRGLAALHLNRGDLIVVSSLPLWCLYSVLVRRRPRELDSVGFLFVLMAIGLAILAPAYLYESVYIRAPQWSWATAGLVLFIAVTSSIVAYLFWNRGVELVGANRAGFTTPFQPAFTAILAILILDEPFHRYDGLGFAIILAGWLLTTSRGRAPR